jgi:hypothetical protein
MGAGRPRKPIDWKLFEQLCHIQCTHSEIASFFHIVVDTLYDRAEEEYEDKFSSIYKRFSEGGKSSLRRNQFRMSEKNCSMAIWLGKQYLGQRDLEIIGDKPSMDNKTVLENKIMDQDGIIESLRRQLAIQNESKTEPELPPSDTQVQYMGRCC